MAKYIERTIISALNQTHIDIEVIVVDDGSTDATCDIVSKWIARDSRIRLIRQQNVGVAAARNAGINCASGEFIAPLDADDLWHKEKIERQLGQFQRANLDVALIYCSSLLIDEDDFIVRPQARDFSYEGHVLYGLVYANFGCASVPLIRRKSLLAVGGYDVDLRAQGGEGCEDKDLYIRLAERWLFARSPEAMVGRRIRSDSISYNVPSMHKSSHLVIRRACRRNQFPSKLIRWAEAKSDRTFAYRSYKQKNYGTAANLLLQAAGRDPVFVLTRSLEFLFLHWRVLGECEPAKNRLKFGELTLLNTSLTPNRQEHHKPISSAILNTREKYISQKCSLATQTYSGYEVKLPEAGAQHLQAEPNTIN